MFLHTLTLRETLFAADITVTLREIASPLTLSWRKVQVIVDCSELATVEEKATIQLPVYC